MYLTELQLNIVLSQWCIKTVQNYSTVYVQCCLQYGWLNWKGSL